METEDTVVWKILFVVVPGLIDDDVFFALTFLKSKVKFPTIIIFQVKSWMHSLVHAAAQKSTIKVPRASVQKERIQPTIRLLLLLIVLARLH